MSSSCKIRYKRTEESKRKKDQGLIRHFSNKQQEAKLSNTARFHPRVYVNSQDSIMRQGKVLKYVVEYNNAAKQTDSNR